jgi:hypothetical protein
MCACDARLGVMAFRLMSLFVFALSAGASSAERSPPAIG